MLNWLVHTRSCMSQKHEIFRFFLYFYSFLEVFPEKYIKKIYSYKGNEERIESETVTITCDL